MFLSILRSGSSGNVTLLEHGDSKILLDLGGQSQKGIHALLNEVSVSLEDIDAVLVTHLHRDHFNLSALKCCVQKDIAVYLHKKNIAAIAYMYQPALLEKLLIEQFTSKPFRIGPLKIQPFGVSHDAKGTTSGFRIWPAGEPEASLCYAADMGIFPLQHIEYFIDAAVLVLESNHNPDLLFANPRRPWHHKKRVSGSRGHLSNQQALEALEEIIQQSAVPPNHIVLCHLSEDHNTPEMVREGVLEMLGSRKWQSTVSVAGRYQRTKTIDIRVVDKSASENGFNDGEQLTLFAAS